MTVCWGDTRGLEIAGKVIVLGACTYLYTWMREVRTLPAVLIPSDKGATPRRRSWIFLGVTREDGSMVVTPKWQLHQGWCSCWGEYPLKRSLSYSVAAARLATSRFLGLFGLAWESLADSSHSLAWAILISQLEPFKCDNNKLKSFEPALSQLREGLKHLN